MFMSCFKNHVFHLRPKKKICVFPIDRSTDPDIFYAKKNNRSAKFGNSFPFPCLFPTSTIEIKNGEYTQVIAKTLYCMSNN